MAAPEEVFLLGGLRLRSSGIQDSRLRRLLPYPSIIKAHNRRKPTPTSVLDWVC